MYRLKLVARVEALLLFSSALVEQQVFNGYSPTPSYLGKL